MQSSFLNRSPVTLPLIFYSSPSTRAWIKTSGIIFWSSAGPSTQTSVTTMKMEPVSFQLNSHQVDPETGSFYIRAVGSLSSEERNPVCFVCRAGAARRVCWMAEDEDGVFVDFTSPTRGNQNYELQRQRKTVSGFTNIKKHGPQNPLWTLEPLRSCRLSPTHRPAVVKDPFRIKVFSSYSIRLGERLSEKFLKETKWTKGSVETVSW